MAKPVRFERPAADSIASFPPDCGNCGFAGTGFPCPRNKFLEAESGIATLSTINRNAAGALDFGVERLSAQLPKLRDWTAECIVMVTEHNMFPHMVEVDPGDNLLFQLIDQPFDPELAGIAAGRLDYLG